MQKKRLYVTAFCFFILSIVLALIVTASTQTETITNMDDTYVNTSAGDTNYDGMGLWVQGTSVETWFKFLLSDVTAPYVTSALLYGYVSYLDSPGDFEIEESETDTWTETNLTWNNKPNKITSEDIVSISSTGWAYWNISASYSTRFDSADTYVGYAIKGDQNILLEDKENTGSSGNVPYLNLTTMTPEVSPDIPEDLLNTYNTTLAFRYTTSDSGNVVNCSLILDGSINMTNSTGQTNMLSVFLRPGIFPGSHTWQIRCYDSNREIYEFSTTSRDFDVLAKIEWTEPSSSTPLDLGVAVMGGDDANGSRQIYSNNTNENVQVTCSSGDCGVITSDWSTTDMSGSQTIGVSFNCSADTAGSFEADFALTSDQDGSSDLLTVNCTVVAPNLRIAAANITFDDPNPTEGQDVNITAGIYNDGNYGVTDAVVQFFEGHYGSGTQIGDDQLVTLGSGASTTVSQTWTAKVGDFDMYVVLDPNVDTNGSITESDETDNYAYKNIAISMWTLFVGNVTGWLALGTEANDTIIKWTVPDTTDSLLYIADKDSNIQFNSLKAFSRDVNGNYMSDDFAEFDNELNTTGYPDSINTSFTSGGVPIKTETFIVFGVEIDNVPVINSTNSSVFETGMMWDSSDDTNANDQYDNTSDEDVLFVTKVNQSNWGMYGYYGYELKVAARLKNYHGPDTQSVTLYTEIK